MEAVNIQQVDKNKLKHDGPLNISLGASRTAKQWRNKVWNWSDFLAKLADPTVTYETVAEYKKAPKQKQAEIKDVGGFVGGWLKDGRRKTGNVQSRAFLTLDADTPARVS